MSDEAKIAEALRLKAENPTWGYIKIGGIVDLHKDKVRRAVEHAERKRASTAVAIIPPASLPALSYYDQARQSLAEAKTLNEVKILADKAAGMTEYARRAHDVELEKDARELRVLAMAEWGRCFIEMKETTGTNAGARGQLRGDVPVGGAAPEPPTDTRPTLADLNVDKKFSSQAQKLASISERALKARLANWRENVTSGEEKITADILKQKPGNTPRARGRAESDDAFDYFPTPPWATRVLMERVLPRMGLHPQGHADRRIWEPACGEGHMAGVLAEYSELVFASDIHDYAGNGVKDFLTCSAIPGEFEWIISNPPFKAGRAEAFVLRALDLAYQGVAMFVALQFLESIGRYEQIFKDRPPTLIAFFAERVPICKGRWDPDASSDAAYVWLVWMKDHAPQAPMWISPGQRAALTKPDDRERFAAWSMPKAEAAE